MLRFIHTSDLHLGKRFGQFPENLRGRLTEARHQSITTLAKVARSHGAEFILIAGDVFDTGTPSPSVIRQAMQAMAADNGTKWVIIPGNHDSLSSGELWKQIANDRPDNVLLCLENKPLEIAPATFVLPAPCMNRRPGNDLTEWMSDAEIAGECMRIGLAHGAVQSFGEDGASEIIAPDRAQRSGLDYLALGDWHGQISINERTWYSGTPEPDRFKHSEPGKALLVEIESSGATPDVRPLETGSFNWQKRMMHTLSGENISKQLDDILPEISLRRKTLLQIAAEGRIRIPDRLLLEEAVRKVTPDFASFEIRSEALANEYEISDLDAIDQVGALRQAARESDAWSKVRSRSSRCFSIGTVSALYFRRGGSMKLRALRLWNVRKFSNCGIAIENIGDGVNVLSAENEFGKSTSFDALHAVFFQPFSGTPKPVQMLRPYSGGSPQIEVDVETSEGQFRISKTYYTGKKAIITEIATNRIIAQADAAEAWISNLIRGGSVGPAGLLWVQQGATEIGGGSNKAKDEERRVREDVLTSVTGDEVEFLTGGRRMLRVLDRTNAELETLVTGTGKPKAGGRYADALSELEDLQNEENELASQISELRTSLSTRRKKLLRLKDLNDPDAVKSRLQQKSDATEQLEAAKEQFGRLAMAEAQERLADEKYQTAKSYLASHQSKLEQLTKLIEQIIDVEAAHKIAELKRDEALSANDAGQKALQTCEERLTKARELLDTAKREKEAERAAEQLNELKLQLEKAEKLRGEVEKLAAEYGVLLVDDDSVDQLEALERQIETLYFRIRAKSVIVQVDYIDANKSHIIHDGCALTDGQTVEITSETCFDIPHIGQLKVSSGSDASTGELEAEVQDVKEQLRSGLAHIKCASVSAAKEQLVLAKAKTSSLMLKRTELETRAPEGIDALKQRSIQLEELCKTSDSPQVSLIDAELEIAAAIEAHRSSQSEREIARLTYHDAKEEFLRKDIIIAGVRKQRQELETELGSEVERNDRLELLQSTFANEQEILAATQKATEQLRANALDLMSVTAAYERASSIINRAQTEIDVLNKEVAELDGRISVSSGHGIEDVYEEITGRCSSMKNRVERFKHEISSLTRLKQALEEARSSAKERYFEPVMAELKPLLTLLLDEASITFDEATLLPRTLAREGLDEDITFLSGGMREQLAILTRLAFARLLAKSGNPVPVILDDALVYSDDERIERMFDALHRQANDLQILVFSCRQRAFERLGGNGLNMVQWKPGEA